MKQFTAVLLCLLLCGCTRQTPAAQPETVPETTAAAVMAGLYDPEHPMEESYPGMVRAYPLTQGKAQGIQAIEKDVLILSGQDATTLTLFTGEELRETASIHLDFLLSQDDPSFQIHENGLSYFDPLKKETLVLDRSLKEVRRITAPSGLSGKPILSADESTLYYATEWSVMAWDLESGIRRTVKELSYESQELTGLHCNDQVLECTVLDDRLAGKRFLSADQGLELHALSDKAALHTGDSGYCAAIPSGYQTLLLFGDSSKTAELLLPGSHWEQQFYLPEDHAVVTVSSAKNGNRLDYYELNTGILRASITLDALQTPKSIVNSKGHSIYILTYDPAADCDMIYRWDVLRQAPDSSNVTSYKLEYRDADNPDMDALEECREYANAIGEKYGITLRIGEDAVNVQPWDYRFEPELLAPILQKELQLLEQRLAQYPEAVLQLTKDHFTGLTICLVRQITGIGDEQSLSNATGIQFFEENEAYVVITTGRYSEQALYHELYHVMETRILTKSTALDQWESLNPADFVYGGDHQNADIYLQGQTRAFIDRYSMEYPKEDRARVMENAMLRDQEDVFRSEYMQRKLNALCVGIREAYRLKKHPEALPWEQYLVTPLVPKT